MKRLAVTFALVAILGVLAKPDPGGVDAAFISTVAGDADCNEQITALDALAVADELSGISSPFCAQLGNVLCQDPLSMQDAMAILRHLAHLPIEQGGRCFAIGRTVEDQLASQGTATIHGTSLFDFDTGTETSVGADVQWQNEGVAVPNHDMFLTPIGGQIAPVVASVPAYPVLNTVWLGALAYSSDRIDGPGGDSPGDIAPGTVFAMLTDQGNLARVSVIAAGYDLEVEWVTYSYPE